MSDGQRHPWRIVIRHIWSPTTRGEWSGMPIMRNNTSLWNGVEVSSSSRACRIQCSPTLFAHFVRRSIWIGLKESSKEYADKLLEGCRGDDPKHDPYTIYGENLARNVGSGYWGQLYEPDDIVNRFVEREVGLPWAQNGHLTNALWRATRYVGCAESETSYPVTKPNGHVIQHTCRIQVCRYAKPGNCSMGSYRNANGVHDWKTPMLADDSPCGPDCPPEGCYE